MKNVAVLTGRRTGHLPSFFVPTPGDLTAQESPAPEICHLRPKKCQCPGVSPGGGGWAQVELTDALQHFSVRVIWCFSLNLFSLLSEKNEVNELLPVNSLLFVVVN